MAALFVLVVSCKKDEKTNATQGPGFRASLETQAGNDKTHLEDGTKVKWDAGDAVLVINNSSEAKEFTTETGVMTDGYAAFQSADATENFYKPNYKAYYPSGLYSTTTSKISLPQTQQYAAGSFGKGFNPMAAQASDETLEFKNICGMLALQLKGNCTVSSIRITSKDDEMLWGEGDLTLTGTDSDASLTLGTLSNGSASITLNCNNEVTLNTANATTFYFVLPNGALSSGFNVVLTDSNGKVWKKSASTNTEIHQNKIRKMSELSVETTTPVVPTQVTITSTCENCSQTLGGTVTVPQEMACEFGLVYIDKSLGEMPTLENGTKVASHTMSESHITGTANFDLALSGLANDKDYDVRAYAMTEDGVVYSSETKTVEYPRSLPSGWTNGKNPHPFTVASGKVVHFSQGNLQYKATGSSATAASGANVGGTWRFAEHQFDFIGADNKNAAQTYTGWIDLFGWGTSGYNHGATCYQPWSTTTTNEQYYVYGDYIYHLYDSNGKADWGKANAISNGGNTVGSWRTLTGASGGEWDYLIKSRPNAANLYGMGKVGICIPGLIILPDDWSWSGDVASLQANWISGQSPWSNVYSYSEWSRMEAAGAVFLPAAGFRNGTLVNNVGSYGFYWSSSHGNYQNASPLFFRSAFVQPDNDYNCRYYGFSVRLVSDN